MIEHSGFRVRFPGSPGEDDRLLYLGDDASGIPLEVMAVELDADALLVIHAMPLRRQYKADYQEAIKWRV